MKEYMQRQADRTGNEAVVPERFALIDSGLTIDAVSIVFDRGRRGRSDIRT
jgi:hypothetical protein